MVKKNAEKRFQKTDPSSWVDLYGDYLYGYAFPRVQDPTVAEDMVQETFMAALKSHERFEGQSSERTWLTSILKHKVVDHIRKVSRERPMEDLEDAASSLEEHFDEKGKWRVGPAKWTTNPGLLLEQKDFWKVLTGCLSGLSGKLARVFRLREMDGLSTDEICKVLDITATNCWVMLHRARMGMRECLEVKWFEG